MAEQTPRYRVIGFLGGDFGLAIAAHNSLRALRASGRQADEVAVEPTDRATPVNAPGRVTDTPGAINLFQMNPLDIGRYSSQWRASVDLSARNVCVPFWELPLVPRDWEPILGGMDIVLAPTRYVADACAAVIGAKRVVHYPQAVYFPEDIAPGRARWGIPDGVTAVIVSLDIGSDIERKNPWAAIDAFQLAFPSESNVRLIVKTKPWPHMRAYRVQAERLAARVAQDKRVQIVDESLDYADVLRLYASCDVMLSLHRSEGLGLHLMEAMSLGTVVVGTGWSGNMDFMTPENSIAVPYRLVPVETEHSAYISEVGRQGQLWAEADVRSAAASLAELHADQGLRVALGANAMADMARQREAQLSGASFDELERALSTPGLTAGTLSAALDKARSTIRRQRLRDKFIAVQRRLGLRR